MVSYEHSTQPLPNGLYATDQRQFRTNATQSYRATQTLTSLHFCGVPANSSALIHSLCICNAMPTELAIGSIAVVTALFMLKMEQILTWVQVVS